MLEEGPSEEVTAEAAMKRPEWLQWNWKGGRGKRQVEAQHAGPGEEVRAYPKVTGNSWSVLSREVKVALAWPALIF